MSGIWQIEAKRNSCSQRVHQRPNCVDVSDVSPVMWCHALATDVGPIHMHPQAQRPYGSRKAFGGCHLMVALSVTGR